MRNDFESNYLAHHGILGMKWGHKNGPPYPLDEKDHSQSEKKAGWMKSLADKHRANVKKKKQKKALEKARATRAENLKKEAEKKAYEEEKEKALKSGKASEILKYKGDLTNEQLQRAVNRINLEKNLSDLSAKEVKTNWDKMDDIMNKVGKVTDWVNKGTNAYNAIEKAVKIFDKDSKEKEKKDEDLQKSLNEIVNSRNKHKIQRYAPLMDNKQLANAISGLKTQETYEEMFKTDKQRAKEAKAKEKKAANDQLNQDIKDILEEMTFGDTKVNRETRRQQEIDDFYDGPEWPDDEEEEKKKKKK